MPIETKCPRYPLLEIIEYDNTTLFHAVESEHDLTVMRECLVSGFDVMTIIDSNGTLWRPGNVYRKRVMPRKWWKVEDWLDPTVEVCVHLSPTGEMSLAELQDIIVNSVEGDPDAHQGRGDWPEMLEAIKHAGAIDQVIRKYADWERVRGAFA